MYEVVVTSEPKFESPKELSRLVLIPRDISSRVVALTPAARANAMRTFSALGGTWSMSNDVWATCQ